MIKLLWPHESYQPDYFGYPVAVGCLFGAVCLAVMFFFALVIWLFS